MSRGILGSNRQPKVLLLDDELAGWTTLDGYRVWLVPGAGRQCHLVTGPGVSGTYVTGLIEARRAIASHRVVTSLRQLGIESG